MHRNQRGTKSVPPELLSAIPRSVKLSVPGFTAAVLALLLLAGAVGTTVWLSAIAVDRAKARDRFERDAVTVAGRVVQLGRVRDGKREVTFRYMAAGQERYGQASLHRRESRGLSPGSEVSVRYLPADPATAYVRGHGPGSIPLWVVPLTALSLALSAALIGANVRRQWKLLESGRPAAARVIASKRGQHGHHRVQYEYTVMSGAVRTSWQEVRTAEAEPGVTAVVLYDPENQGRAARYPLPLVRLDRRAP